jgi:hypothetical protein
VKSILWMLEREIGKARAATAEHSGKAKREKRVIGFGREERILPLWDGAI